jgi:SM-20-related protein
MPAIERAIDLESIEETLLQKDPFDYIVVPACIASEALENINRDYPGIERPGNLSVDDVNYGVAFRKFLEECRGPEFAAQIGRKFDLDLSRSPVTITVRKYCEKSDGNIHTDHPSKVITVLVYFNQDWSSNDGRLRFLRSDGDIEDYAAEVPPIGGTLLAFRRTDVSWHGHTTFVGERRMVQVNFLRSDRLSRWKQQVDRIGTRTMKRALRLFSPGS